MSEKRSGSISGGHSFRLFAFTVNGEPTRRSVRMSADGTKISVNPRGLVVGIR